MKKNVLKVATLAVALVAMTTIISFGFTSCINVVVDEGGGGGDIVGTWDLIEQPNVESDIVVVEYAKVVIYNVNNTVQWIFADGDINYGTWSVSGNKLTETDNALKITITQTFSIKDNKLTYSNEPGLVYKRR